MIIEIIPKKINRFIIDSIVLYSSEVSLQHVVPYRIFYITYMPSRIFVCAAELFRNKSMQHPLDFHGHCLPKIIQTGCKMKSILLRLNKIIHF